MPRKPSGLPAGRPARGLDRRITVMFAPELIAQVEEIAARKGQTISYFIRQATEKAVAHEAPEQEQQR